MLKMWFGNKKLDEQTHDQRDRIKILNERFNRWHDKQLSLSTFVINLLLSISMAGIGFLVSDAGAEHTQNLKCDNPIIFKLSIYCLIASLVLGLIALVCRLNDFRLTKEIIKWRKLQYKVKEDLKYQWDEKLDIQTCVTKINKLRNRTNYIGIATWWFFYLQMISLTIATIGLVSNLL